VKKLREKRMEIVDSIVAGTMYDDIEIHRIFESDREFKK